MSNKTACDSHVSSLDNKTTFRKVTAVTGHYSSSLLNGALRDVRPVLDRFRRRFSCDALRMPDFEHLNQAFSIRTSNLETLNQNTFSSTDSVYTSTKNWTF